MRMISLTVASVVAVTACASAAAPEAAVSAAAAASSVQTEDRYSLRSGRIAQGALSFWRTEPGAEVYIDKKPVKVDNDGYFVIGFNRDFDGNAELLIVFADGTEATRTLPVEKREFRIERIDNLPPSKVNKYTPEQLAQIREETAAKAAARANPSPSSYWRAGFDWPVRGRISGKYGAQRILNGVPKRFHSGTDVAAPTGTAPADFVGMPVRAPTTGKVTLAASDFYFEGGVVFIDHGQNIESVLMHLEQVLVRPGQTVTKGEIVGTVGATGRATGPHLHWTVNWQGQPVDPELIVPPMEF
ncbi:MAG: M23 family metallopeptidase [Pseudomonadota bacterium]